MSETTNSIGLTTVLQDDMDGAQARVTDALKAEGFGVLSEIDMSGTLKAKLDVDYRPYKILGACNPAMAHRALETTEEAGLLLPCNVTLVGLDNGTVQVSIIDPNPMMDVVKSGDLTPIAQDVRERLVRVVAALAGD